LEIRPSVSPVVELLLKREDFKWETKGTSSRDRWVDGENRKNMLL